MKKMFIIILFKNGESCGARTAEGNPFIFSFPFETYEKAKQYGEDIAKLLGYKYKIFEEAELVE